MIANIASLLMLVTAPVTDPADCAGHLCNTRVLAPFFSRLDDATNMGRSVHILQIGDSHTAGDMITNAWRTRLQAHHGFGGRGVLAPGRPYAGVLTFGVSQSMTSRWKVNSAFGKERSASGAPVGIAGFSMTASRAGERLRVNTDSPDQNFDRVTVCGARRPDGGNAVIEMGGQSATLDLRGERPGAVCRSIDTEDRVPSAELVTQGDGVVTVTAFGTFVRKGGVTLSNLGIVGSQLIHLAREDDAIVADELAEFRPDLIVIAFGTNEAFSTALTPDRYEQDLRAQVARLRRLLGRPVPILLLEVPDVNTRAPAVANSFGQGVPCPTTSGQQWYTPGLVGAIRERQTRVARDLGLAFWDWSAAMGGVCASSRWNAADPPLVRGDHIHFTRNGGDRIGAMLFEDIETAASAQRSPSN